MIKKYRYFPKKIFVLSFLAVVFFELVGKEGEGHGKVFVLYEDGCWDIEECEGEVPDGLYATADHVVADRLCLVGGYGDDADFDACAFDVAFHFLHGEDVFVVYLESSEMGVFVKGYGYVHAEGVEFTVGEYETAEGADADKYGLVGVVVAEVVFECMEECVDLEADTRHAGDAAQTGEVFAHKYGVEVEALRHVGRGDI